MYPHHWTDPHMMRVWRSLFRASYITLGVFLAIFVIFHISGALYTSALASGATRALQKGLVDELAHLKREGDAVAQDPKLKEYLAAEDSERLVAFLQSERIARGIGLMGVTNAEGTIMGRTRSPGLLGDNVLLTTPQGRRVDRVGTAQSIEISGVDPGQLLMTTGREVREGAARVGALFTNHLMDDAYAKRFRDSYLPPGTEVAFYTKNFGVYGASTENPEERRLVSSYFNSGSAWIQEGTGGRIMALPDGSHVLVENVVFEGLEQSPGGALLFVPRYDTSVLARISTATLMLATFLVLSSFHHRRTRGEERGWRYALSLGLIAIPVFGLTLVALQLHNTGAARLARVPYPLYNSTLRLQPEWGVYAQGFERPIGIVADMGDEPINAVELAISYDPEAIEVHSFEPAQDACAYVIERSLDAQAGVARLGCVLAPQHAHGSLRLANLLVEPKREGMFELSFLQGENKVLADDGVATDVLRMAQGGAYVVQAASSLQSAPSLFSSTHPNQSRWYRSATARFIWQGDSDAAYFYTVDTRPETTPVKGTPVWGNTVEVSFAGDGVFYFHLQRAEGGPVAHYRAQIDRTPPTIVSMRLSEESVTVGSVVRFSFSAEDGGSGIQRNYYVDLGSRLFLPVGEQLFVPFMEAGSQQLTLRVYDDAGNYTEQKKVVEVKDR